MTGGAGFLGSHVVDRLLERGADVVILDDLSGGFWRNVPERARFVRGSIEDPDLVSRLYAEHRFQHVYHLAAYAAEGLSHFIRRRNYGVNLVGSVNLINAAVNHGVECFVFASSIAIYGAERPPFSEETRVAPVDPYGIAKAAVEADLAAARELFGLRSIVFRPHNVYGERQNLVDPYRNVVGIFMRQVLAGEPCSLFGDGSQTRAFTHVADVAPLIADSVDNPAAHGEAFNVGSDEITSVAELAQRVQDALGRQVGVTRLPARPEAHDVHARHAKARERLGYAPRVALAQGLARMAAWAKTVEFGRPLGRGDIEIERNLPPSWRGLPTAEGR